jgi:catechol 2,3-dioxygenase-like lactoylglutathione lyase family enzyme
MTFDPPPAILSQSDASSVAAPARPPIVALGGAHPYQVGIVVPDLEAAMRAYGAPHGAGDVWKVWTYDENIMGERRYRGSSGTFSMRIALGGSDPQLELIQPLQGPSIYHEYLEERGCGLHHLAFRVPDLTTAIAEMEQAGFALLQAGFGFGADRSGGFAYFDTVRALGYVAEAVEPPHVRRDPEDTFP